MRLELRLASGYCRKTTDDSVDDDAYFLVRVDDDDEVRVPAHEEWRFLKEHSVGPHAIWDTTVNEGYGATISVDIRVDDSFDDDRIGTFKVRYEDGLANWVPDHGDATLFDDNQQGVPSVQGPKAFFNFAGDGSDYDMHFTLETIAT